MHAALDGVIHEDISIHDAVRGAMMVGGWLPVVPLAWVEGVEISFPSEHQRALILLYSKGWLSGIVCNAEQHQLADV